MVANLHCVRPCYRNNASGLGEAAAQEVWHEEAVPQCRNIYFTPLVHSMYALHLRRWLRVFPVDSLLLLRFDDIVLRPIDALQRLATFLNLPPFPEGFKVEQTIRPSRTDDVLHTRSTAFPPFTRAGPTHEAAKRAAHAKTASSGGARARELHDGDAASRERGRHEGELAAATRLLRAARRDASTNVWAEFLVKRTGVKE